MVLPKSHVPSARWQFEKAAVMLLRRTPFSPVNTVPRADQHHVCIGILPLLHSAASLPGGLLRQRNNNLPGFFGNGLLLDPLTTYAI
jgi:hypothetical protein